MKIRIVLSFFLLVLMSYSQSHAQCSVNYQPYMYCGYGDMINSFTLNGITSTGNGSGCPSNGYISFNSPTWLLVPGQTYNWSATVGGGSWSQGLGIWIDFNGNGSYESSEGFVSSGTSTAPSGSLTVPANAAGGTTKMRVRCSYAYTFSTGQACTDSHGFGWGETEDYTVIICTPPTINQAPNSTFACTGGSGTMTVDATAAGFYQWQVNSGNGWADVTNSGSYSGVNTDTLRLSNVSSTLNGAKYRCIVGASCASSLRDTSESGDLTVYALTDIIDQTITDTSCASLSTILRVKADGVITNYTWQIYNQNDKAFYNITSNPFVLEGDTLRVQNIQDTLNGTIIRVIVSGICGIDTSSEMTMTVNPLPQVVVDPADITSDQGKDVTFQISAAGVNLKYQWMVGYKDTFAVINNGGIYSGVKSDRLTVKGVSRAQNEYQFLCEVKGSGSCAAQPDSSNIALLFVNPAVSVGQLGADEYITLYPNPATTSEVVIKATVKNAESYTIVDKTGRMVANGPLDNSGNTRVNISALAADVYNVQITDNNGRLISTLKLTKL